MTAAAEGRPPRAGTGGRAYEGDGESAPERVLLMGNEAIARGALEGGVGFCAGYPGNPSSEIIDTLVKEAAGTPLHVQWSVNEIVALEAAAGAAFAGLRALVAMKQNGLNVCADFLTTVNLSGTDRGGLVVVVSDDPGPLTSSNEEDSRLYAPLAELPLLEPATPQQAKDMTAWALMFSQEQSLPVLIRSVSRLSHGRAGVVLGALPPAPADSPSFRPRDRLLGLPGIVAFNHARLHEKMHRVREGGAGAQFNTYSGPEDCELVVITAGLCTLYAREALVMCGLEERVGLLSLGMVWPFPRAAVLERLRRAAAVLVVEQIEPFVEEQVKLVYADHVSDLGVLGIAGKATGHIPVSGEVDTGSVVGALTSLLGAGPSGRGSGVGAASAGAGPATWRQRATAVAASLPPRDVAFCQACPHRASFWAIKTALALDGRDGVVAGDIGCYGLAAGPTGFSQIDTLHCMGAGLGVAGGLGVLGPLGFAQPVVAVAGDSTFYHACIPGLINARMHGADLTFVILDNGTTAMTGFQPHPGSPCTPMDPERAVLPPEYVCSGLGIDAAVIDPVADVRGAAEAIYDCLQEEGVRVVILRRACSTWEKRVAGTVGRAAQVDAALCVGEACGCDRFCARVLGCPGNRWDAEAGRAYVDPDYCDGCGLCVELCPRGALSLTDDADRGAAGLAPA